MTGARTAEERNAEGRQYAIDVDDGSLLPPPPPPAHASHATAVDGAPIDGESDAPLKAILFEEVSRRGGSGGGSTVEELVAALNERKDVVMRATAPPCHPVDRPRVSGWLEALQLDGLCYTRGGRFFAL